MPQATTFDKRIFISSEKKGKKDFLTSDFKDFKAATHQTLLPASIESF